MTIQVLKDGLSAVHVPYSYGFAIILLTIIVKAATLPLTKKQVCNKITSWLVPGYKIRGLTAELLVYFRWNQLWRCKICSHSLKQSSRDMQATRFA
jgi:hypothetical protein